MTKAKAHTQEKGRGGKWPMTRAGFRVRKLRPRFLLIVMLGKLFSLSGPASSYPFYFSQLRGSNRHEDLLKGIKCCPNVGIVIIIVRYQTTRRESRDLMLQTKGLKLAAHKLFLYVLFGPQWGFFFFFFFIWARILGWVISYKNPYFGLIFKNWKFW